MSRVSSLLKKPKMLLVLALFIALGALGFFVRQNQSLQKQVETQGVDKDAEVRKIVEKLGRLMVLPDNETPTIATVTDITKIKNQPFFSKAQNGDKIIIYVKAKKAILFRVEDNKIIDIAPVSIGSPSVTPNPNGGSPAPSVTVTPTITPFPTPTVTPATQ